MQPKDLLLLCSDGLTEEVSDAEVSSLLQVEATQEVIAQTLIKAAIEAGGSDNITVVLISQESGEDSSVS